MLKKLLALSLNLLFGIFLFSPIGIFGQNKATNADTIVKGIEFSPVVITGYLIPTDTRNTVNSVKVITEETIQNRAVSNLEELLGNEANIRISHDPILGGSIGINGIRGENLKILIDGVPVIGRNNGSVDASQIPLSNVRQVEIIEGSQSLIYGSDAAGGVINIITKNTQLKKFEANIKSLYEINGSRNLNINLGQKFGSFVLLGHLGGQQFRPKNVEGRRDNVWNPNDFYDARLALTYRKGTNFSLIVSGDLFDQEVTNLDSIKRPMFKPYAFDDYYYTKRKNLSARSEYWISNKLYNETTVAYNHFNREKKSVRYDFNNDSTSYRQGEQDTTYAQSYLLRTSLASKKWNNYFDFLVGVDNYFETIRGPKVFDTIKARSLVTRNEAGIFTSIQAYPVKGLTVMGGTRVVYNENYGIVLTPSIWVNYKLLDQLVIKGSYANGFRSPALKELYFNFIDNNHHIIGNINLKPESSHNFRLELAPMPIKTDFGIFSAQATGFYNKVNNLIELVDQVTSYTYVNINQYITKGGRIGVTFTRPFVQFSSYLTRTGFFNEVSNKVDSVPSNIWSTDWTNSLQIANKQKSLMLNIWLKSTGSTPYFYLNTQNQLVNGISKNWTNLNASMKWDIVENSLSITGGVKNLLNKQSVKIAGSGIGPHGSEERTLNVHWGRSYFLQANYTFRSKK